MRKANYAWLLPGVLILVSLALNYPLAYNRCPAFFETMKWEEACEPHVHWNQYGRVYCRAGPYFAGMYVAHFYINGLDKTDVKKAYEWVAFATVLVIGFFGANLPE